MTSTRYSLNELLQKRNLVMGILNVTPDSFSDGGLYLDSHQAVQHAYRMIKEGADILDVGGESTRPGALPVSVEEQINRVVTVIEKLSRTGSTPISIDTTQAEVAHAAITAGAEIINDTSGLTDSPEMVDVVVKQGVHVVVMHRRGQPSEMQNDTVYDNLHSEILDFLQTRTDILRSHGVPQEVIWVDPGVGFGKSLDGNLQIVNELELYDKLGYPVVVGVSRKSLIGKTLGREVGDRLAGSLALTAFVASRGPNRIHRVHDVRANSDVLRMVEAVRGVATLSDE